MMAIEMTKLIAIRLPDGKRSRKPSRKPSGKRDSHLNHQLDSRRWLNSHGTIAISTISLGADDRNPSWPAAKGNPPLSNAQHEHASPQPKPYTLHPKPYTLHPKP